MFKKFLSLSLCLCILLVVVALPNAGFAIGDDIKLEDIEINSEIIKKYMDKYVDVSVDINLELDIGYMIITTRGCKDNDNSSFNIETEPIGSDLGEITDPNSLPEKEASEAFN